MQVVQLKQKHHILTGSPAKHAVQGVSQNVENITWDVDGFEDGEGDY